MIKKENPDHFMNFKDASMLIMGNINYKTLKIHTFKFNFFIIKFCNQFLIIKSKTKYN